MMRIRSLEKFPEESENLLLKISPSAVLPALPIEIGSADIVSRTNEVDTFSSPRLVFIATGADETETTMQAWFGTGKEVCEFWAPRVDLEEFTNLLRIADGFAVTGFRRTADWVRVEVRGAQSTDRASADFLVGLETPGMATEDRFGLCAEHVNSPSDDQASPSNRSMVKVRAAVNRIVIAILPIAKRIKPYLPTKLVIALYKTLERIR